MTESPTPDLSPDAPLLVLASGSPRRSEILGAAGVPFEIVVSGIEERTRPGESAEDLVIRLAREKCLDVAGRLPDTPSRPVLGADTIVVSGGAGCDLDEAVLGKPRDEAHAVELLTRLAGRTHRVMTGVAVAWTDGRERVPGAGSAWTRVVTSRVTMRPATRDELAEYVAMGESLDKAGGYALQGGASRFVTAVEGDRTNVIGLPESVTLALLREAGVPDASLGR